MRPMGRKLAKIFLLKAVHEQLSQVRKSRKTAVEVFLSIEALFETVCENESFGSDCFVLIVLFVQGRRVIEKLVAVRAC